MSQSKSVALNNLLNHQLSGNLRPQNQVKCYCGDPADMTSLPNSLLILLIEQINIKPRVVFKFVLVISKPSLTLTPVVKGTNLWCIKNFTANLTMNIYFKIYQIQFTK